MTFTEDEIEYLKSQPLGRLCTLGPTGAPQAKAVGVHLGPHGTLDVVGYANADSRKWRNVQTDPRVTFIVDDLASRNPWTVRGLEIRGHAETVLGADAAAGGMSGDVIRIHPRRILSWGINEAGRMTARNVA
ncbi:PPOX class F420-dependent oxidoreductase [Haloactinomyces albus]|uniref:Pyridoxamine 5'-phosphate oxidase family protein n=1 Tax=Haloactinomyces albus TaxID=1352928 RepID=A0AAE3Z8Y7_9ACTN|nr:PPOX class F420-dependent oxidoreductase [Haloactinomyces albus]MDR7300516.1 pyridoxamine 5'-phosphate oxidase family protein [Haloactinomyces albus]